MKLFLALAVVVSVVFVTTCTGGATQPGLAVGDVRILSQTKQEIVAVYVQEDGSGVHITSTASDNGTCINVTSLDGREIILARHSNIASASLLRIMGHAIVIRKVPAAGDGKGHRWIDYALPFEVSHHLDVAISQHHFQDELLHHLDENAVNQTKQHIFNTFLPSSDIHTLVEACHALGDAGIFGFENPAALNLYSFVLRYEKFRNEYMSDPESFNITSIDTPRRWRREIDPAATSSSSGVVCRSLRDLYNQVHPRRRHLFDCGARCPIGPECLGMCGPRCDVCWYLLCGDCCHHVGCYQHDVCCDERGFFHFSCLFPRNFSCSSYVCTE